MCIRDREYGKKKTIYLTTQFNHTNELTPQAIASVDLLLSAGVIVNNQTVLLRGVNDDPDTCLLYTSRCV